VVKWPGCLACRWVLRGGQAPEPVCRVRL